MPQVDSGETLVVVLLSLLGGVLGMLLAALTSASAIWWVILPFSSGWIPPVLYVVIKSTTLEGLLYETGGQKLAVKKEIKGTPNLGDEVEDMITGLKGIVLVYSKHLTGCDRITIQPKAGADGKCPEWVSFDITVARILKRAAVVPKSADDLRNTPEEPAKNTKGGPAKNPGAIPSLKRF